MTTGFNRVPANFRFGCCCLVYATDPGHIGEKNWMHAAAPRMEATSQKIQHTVRVLPLLRRLMRGATPEDTKNRQLKTLPSLAVRWDLLGLVASIRLDLYGDTGAACT